MSSQTTLDEIQIIVISKNQADSLHMMRAHLETQFPNVKRLFVLDRCSDNSKQLLTDLGESFIEKLDGNGFEAGRARDFGMAHFGYDKHFLLFDRDRFPLGFTESILIKGLSSYDICLTRVSEDIRDWFKPEFVSNPNFRKIENDVYTPSFTIRKEMLGKILPLNGGRLFNQAFDGNWGGEDMSMGDFAYALGGTCGGFPNTSIVCGGFYTKVPRPSYNIQMNVRKNLAGVLKTTLRGLT